MKEKELREKILNILDGCKSTHITTRTIIHKLDLNPGEKRLVKKIVKELVEDGVLVRFKKNYFGISKKFNLISGKMDVTKDGYGFLIPDEGFNLKEDIFIPKGKMGDAFHKDRVLVEIEKSRGKKGKKMEGRVLQVLSRNIERLICKVEKVGKKKVCRPIDGRYRYSIAVKGKALENVKIGDIVEVDVEIPPERFTRARGKIVDVLGEKGLRDVEYKIIVKRHGIREYFPPEVIKEAEEVASLPDDRELKKRVDYTENKIVTIDGEDARDFDDAVEVKKLENGNYLLGVHIADVSHYVKSGSLLDREAFLRGNSVYFPDRAIPMLPKILSNDICSLKPDEKRLTFSVIMEITPSGKVRKSDFHLSCIKSYRRMTYTEVQKILDGDIDLSEKYKDLIDDFFTMKELCEILYRRRRKRGAVDFDLPEERFEFKGENVIGIYRGDRFLSHRIIEEFMIVANVSVAEYLVKMDYPLIYRIHEAPDEEKVLEFLNFIKFFGFDFKLDIKNLSPHDFQKISDALSGVNIGDFLLYQMLRTFKLAIYSEKNPGHFGLSLKNYTHFTSPIRRYADLVNHRILKRAIGRKKPPKVDLKGTSKHISERERKTTEAERDAIRYEKCKLMESKIGEVFEGYVSFVRDNGFYVELEDFFVEGFVPVYTLKGYFIFNEKKQQLFSHGSRLSFSPGDKVLIRVAGVDRLSYKIEFSFIKKI